MAKDEAKKKVTVWRKDVPQPETFEGVEDSGVDEGGLFYVQQGNTTTVYPCENLVKATIVEG